MLELWHQIKWQFKLLIRNQVIVIAAVVTAIYIALFFAMKGWPNMDKVLTLLILSDPAIIGLFFIGIGILMERSQHVIEAIFVSPANIHKYLIARIFALSIIGWLCGLVMGFAALGFDFHYLHFSVAVFGLCMLFCNIGIWLVCFTDKFLNFMLLTVPVLLFGAILPLLNYFGLTNFFPFKLMPIEGPLNILQKSYGIEISNSTLLLSYALLFLWIGISYFFAYRNFKLKIVNG